MKRRLWLAAILGLAGGMLITVGRAETQERFDHKVRNDFFAGFTGDRAALARGMKTCKEILANNPKHAEALVWHGAGLFFEAGQAFQSGDQPKGMELTGKALAEMDEAVALEPDNIGVRIPRGAAVLSAARSMPDGPFAQSLFQRGIEDHLRAYELQKNHLDQLGEHPLGELLFALADAYSRTGKPDRAEEFFRRIEARTPGSVYAKRAAKYLETREPLPVAETRCFGCHTGN
jgi:tetratricopeptide (TPR) repeat protein